MRTIEIPRKEWLARLDEFTRIHEGWLVSLDLEDADGVQTAIDSLPLFGISVDRAAAAAAIVISVARSPGEHVTHVTGTVTRLLLQVTDEGADAGLELEFRDATRAALRLRTAARPETVDGIAARH